MTRYKILTKLRKEMLIVFVLFLMRLLVYSIETLVILRFLVLLYHHDS